MRALRFWKRSLTARLVSSFLLLSLLTVVLLGGIAFDRARQALSDSILDRLAVTATLQEEALSQWVDDQLQDFLLLSELPSIETRAAVLLDEAASEAERWAARAAVSRLLAAAIGRNGEWQEILVLSRRSEIVLSTDERHEGDYRIRDRYFVEGRQATFVQKVYPSPVTFAPTITLATPVPPAAPAGVLALHLNLGKMDEIVLERTGLGVGSESYLVDRFNVLISGERFGRDDYPRGVRSTGIDAALEGVDGSGLYQSYKGVPVIGVYRWIDDLEVALLIEMPQEVAFAPARRLARVLFTVGLSAAAALTLGIFLLARQIARPVLAITRAAVEVAGGDLTSQAPILTDDEVGVLGRTFNQMTDRLRALYDDLGQEIAVRQRAEEELAELVAELEAKNAELERFTYTVSHDLKSPLVTIQGFLGLLRKDALAGDFERMEKDIERISAAARKMQALLEDLLELSRIGRQVNPPQEVSLKELAEEAVSMVAGQLEERGVEVEISPALDVAVSGDRTRLLEVFQNLVDNASRFMGDETAPRIEIGVEERRARLDEAGPEKSVPVVCVRDNGTGIDRRYLGKIFGLFERLDPAVEGTGIGLALARRIVELHGGRIWAESEGLGHGSTFCVYLPPLQGAKSSTDS